MNKWIWIDPENRRTNEVELPNSKKYHIGKMRYGKSFRVDIYEDKIVVASENTFNNTFIESVDQEQEVEDQILEWATCQIKQFIQKCNKCYDIKFCKDLTKGAKSRMEFSGYSTLCTSCRKEIWAIISEKSRLEREKEHLEKMKELAKNPPKVIGNFKKRIDAYRFLMKSPNPDREDWEDGLVFCKGIIQLNDGLFFPVFLIIESPGGEHWDTCFFANNYKEVISQSHIFPFIEKRREEVFPYQYESLCHIKDDFHQQTRFGNISQKSVRHQFTNQIKFEKLQNWEELKDAVHIEVRSYFSIQHILSAANFYNKLSLLEASFSDELNEDEGIFHRSLIVSIILSCVCFLESTINELFVDAAENNEGILRDMSKSKVGILGKMWKRGIPRTASYNIIEKYQIALVLIRKEELELGVEFVQNISFLIKLRNALTHFEPETVTTRSKREPESVRLQKLEKQFNGKFELSKFTGENNLFFPDKCLSIGCAKWAIDSVVYFSDFFFDRIELIPPYQNIRYKIEQYLGTATNRR